MNGGGVVKSDWFSLPILKRDHMTGLGRDRPLWCSPLAVGGKRGYVMEKSRTPIQATVNTVYAVVRWRRSWAVGV